MRGIMQTYSKAGEIRREVSGMQRGFTNLD
jgi:hypothetical protein